MEDIKYLYRVTQGRTEECAWLYEATNECEEVLAYARSANEALSLAQAYDDGDMQPDNIVIDGQTVVALCDQSIDDD